MLSIFPTVAVTSPVLFAFTLEGMARLSWPARQYSYFTSKPVRHRITIVVCNVISTKPWSLLGKNSKFCVAVIPRTKTDGY